MKRIRVTVAVCVLLALLLSVFCLCVMPAREDSSSLPESTSAMGSVDLPDVSYTLPEQEEPTVPSQPSVETTSKPWAIVKVASELPLLQPEPTKTVTLPHKTVTATYYGKGYREETNTPPFYIYTTDDGEVLRFEAVGGELVYYEAADAYLKGEPEDAQTITLAEAQKIAEDFVGEYIDLTCYTNSMAKKESRIQGYQRYVFQYGRDIDGMATRDIINVAISLSGELIRYTAKPHLFDCVQIGTVDKEAIRQRFEKELRAEGMGMDYILYCEIITLNDKGEPCVLYEYYYDHDKGEHSGIYSKEIPLIEGHR